VVANQGNFFDMENSAAVCACICLFAHASFPIKAYRPCPNFIDRGGFYQRSGQGLDEIAFGRDSTFDGGKN
jgi:hypothetical protein